MSIFLITTAGATATINETLLRRFSNLLAELCGDPYCAWSITWRPDTALYPNHKGEIVEKKYQETAVVDRDFQLRIVPACLGSLPVTTPHEREEISRQRVLIKCMFADLE